MTVTVGLLRMDDLPEHALHVRGDYPALYAHLFRNTDTRLIDIAVHAGDGPASLRDADVWLLTGSRHSVYDDLDWMRSATELVRELLASERPTVGICFGHQLIGHTIGGRVERADDWGLGVQSYAAVEPLPWFPDAAPALALVASHRDQVFDAPADATIWCTTGYCPNAGMLVGERAWSVQGHPEFTADVARALYDGRRELLGDDAVAAAIASLDTPLSNEAFARAVVASATA